MSNPEQQISVDPKLLVATPIPNGWSWTLASRLGEMLEDAENRFGQRDLSYTILGIEFYHLPHPWHWFPNFKKNIVIQLPVADLTNLFFALGHLAHECIHLLTPTGDNVATVLEEGLATWFSAAYTQKLFGRPLVPNPNSENEKQYLDALNLITPLLEKRPSLIQDLRAATNKPISHATKDDLLALGHSDMTPEIAERLAKRF